MICDICYLQIQSRFSIINRTAADARKQIEKTPTMGTDNAQFQSLGCGATGDTHQSQSRSYEKGAHIPNVF